MFFREARQLMQHTPANFLFCLTVDQREERHGHPLQTSFLVTTNHSLLAITLKFRCAESLWNGKDET